MSSKLTMNLSEHCINIYSKYRDWYIVPEIHFLSRKLPLRKVYNLNCKVSKLKPGRI